MLDTHYMFNNIKTEKLIEFCKKEYLRTAPLEIYKIEDGVVLPLKRVDGGPLFGIGGVLNKGGNYVEESAQIGKGDTLDRFSGKYEYNTEEEIYDNKQVIYLGAYPVHWGHFLVDFAHRMWIFLDDKYSDLDIVYCADENVEVSGPQLDFFELLGVNAHRLKCIRKPTRFSEILIPEPAYMACDYYTAKYYDVFKCVVEAANRKSHGELYDKIYLSRRHLAKANGTEVGERGIEEAFVQNGYHSIHMESLSLVEQIQLLSNCKEVAALNGTLCHNYVFASEGTQCIVLNKTGLLNTHQVLISKMISPIVYYVDVYKEPFAGFPVSYGHGPFLISKLYLVPFFAENGMLINIKDYGRLYAILYLSMCIKMRLIRTCRKLMGMLYRKLISSGK